MSSANSQAEAFLPLSGIFNVPTGFQAVTSAADLVHLSASWGSGVGEKVEMEDGNKI